MNFTVQDLLKIPFAQEVGVRNLDLSRTFRDVSTDSRSIKHEDLFIAIKGPHFDGHHYLEQVAKEGALAAVVSSRWYAVNKGKHFSLPLLVVKNTLDAFGALAAIYRRKFQIPVLAIAGSNGKTTTKELIAHVLSGEMDVLKNEANFNNQIGVPHTLFRLREGHRVAVIEMGTNHSGEMAWLCKAVQPTLALITNIGREHLEFFKDLKGVAREEKSVFDYVFEHGGTVFINTDDASLRTSAKGFGERAITYGTGRSADVHAHKIGFAKDGRLEIRVECEGKSFRVRSRLVADYTPNMIGAAVAVGLHFGLRHREMREQVEAFYPHDKRLEVQHISLCTPAAKSRDRSVNVTVLNDAYNANPDSMLSALRTLTEFPSQGRRFAVLGDMFELGETSSREHRALGRKIVGFSLNGVLFTGKDMELAWKSYHSAAGPKKSSASYYFHHKSELAKALKEILRPGDTVLIKGSRGMKMEEVLELVQK